MLHSPLSCLPSCRQIGVVPEPPKFETRDPACSNSLSLGPKRRFINASANQDYSFSCRRCAIDSACTRDQQSGPSGRFARTLSAATWMPKSIDMVFSSALSPHLYPVQSRSEMWCWHGRFHQTCHHNATATTSIFRRVQNLAQDAEAKLNQIKAPIDFPTCELGYSIYVAWIFIVRLLNPSTRSRRPAVKTLGSASFTP
jgi:hypothetical protein